MNIAEHSGRVLPHKNPFRVSRVSSLEYRCEGLELKQLVERLKRQQWRGAIVGPHGHGKSTLLRSLDRILQKRGYRTCSFFLNDTSKTREFLRSLRGHQIAGAILLLDGAEQLNRLSWLRLRWLARKSQGIVISAHRAGRLPLLHQCKTSTALLDSLLAELDPGDARAAFAHHAFAQAQGNLRETFFALYDLCAGRTAAPPVDAHAKT